MPEHQGNTGKVNKVKLESSIDRVVWTSGTGSPGAKTGVEVNTHFVGNNTEIKIEISDKSGKKFDTVKGKISGNSFWKEITVPEKAKDELYAEAKISKLGLTNKSNPMYLYPKIEIKNVKWDKKEARRGDVLKLTADISGVADGVEGEIQIWEYDDDLAHDLITKFPVIIKNNKIETDWEYEYHEDTDDIPTEEETEKGYNPPEYFFRVVVGGVTADSGLLEFKDWIEIKLQDDEGNPIADEEYIIYLPDGTTRRGNLDAEGKVKLEDIPPGNYRIVYPNTASPDDGRRLIEQFRNNASEDSNPEEQQDEEENDLEEETE